MGAEGFILKINESLIKNLQDADKAIESLDKHSTEAYNNMQKAFDNINNLNLDKFIATVNAAKEKLSGMGDIKLNVSASSNLGNITINGLDTAADKAFTVSNALQRLIETLNSLNASGGKDFLGGLNSSARETMKDMNREAKKLEKTFEKIDEAIQKYNVNAGKIAQKLSELWEAQRKLNDEMKETARNNSSMFLNPSIKPTTLNELKAYANQIKWTMNNLDPKSEEWRKLNSIYKQTNAEIQNINNSMREMKKQHTSLMDISGQLARKLALLFSVSQIQGYIGKLVEVRGEFELNQRAIQAILQDKEKADEVWQKTIDLAVRSPFRVKELVSYTKQLAAYRIEADKLYDTNKMLADISAGLGVDMKRLILAFGQVRSAAYLRGTELRQFTEAGIPILEELSKYFTELEGRAISVGDVFEMVSKRMVLFEDVQEIFKRMTSEGGVFFNMQEIQAETLNGMMSNLRDATDIMLNEIGKANEGTIKGLINSFRILITNYKDIIDATKMWAVVLSPTISILALTKIATSNLGKSIYGLITNSNLGFTAFAKYEKMMVGLTNKSKIAGKAVGLLGKALGGIGVTAVIAGFAFLVKWISKTYLEMTEASRVAKRLKKDLDGIFIEDTGKLNKSIDTYTDLVARLNEANQGSKERREIISGLNNEYGEYLNFVVDENTTIQQLTDSYDSLAKSMKERSALSTYQKGIEKIEESYGEALNSAKDSFYELFAGTSIKVQGGGLSDAFKAIVPSKKEIDEIYSLLIQKIETLDSDAIDSLSEQQQLIQEIVKGYYGDEFFLSRDYTQSIKLIDLLLDKKKQEEKLQDEINARYKETLRSREANLAMQELENKYKASQREIRGRADLSDFDVKKMLDEIQQQFELDKIELKFRFGEISEQEMQEQKDRIINWATATVASVNENIKTKLGGIFSEEELSRVLITQEKQARGINSIIADIKSGWEAQNKIIADNISLKSAGLKIDEKQQQSAERLKKLYEEVAKILGIELKDTRRMSEEMRSAVNDILPSDFQITLEDAYRGIDAIISDLKTKEKEQVTIIEQINKAKESSLYFTEEELAQYDESLKKAEEEYYWIKKKLELIDPSTKNPISVIRADDINAKLEEKYQLDAIDRQKTETELLQEAAREKDAAIAREAQLLAMKEMGVTVTKEELALARKDIEQLTLRWKLLGGTEKEKKTGSRSNSLYDERIKVIDDMNKKFKELNRTLDKGESIQGAFESYIDAFTTAFEGINWIPKNAKEMSPQEFLTKVLNFTDENKLVEFLDKLAKEPMKAFEKIKVELAKGKYVYDMKVGAKVEMDEDLQEKVQNMFDQYDLSIELKKLDIPDDLAKSLFDVDILNLDEFKKKFEELQPQFIGTDMEDKYKDYLDKIDDLEKKAAKERMKTYVNYLKEEMSDRVKLRIDTLKKIKEIEESKEFKPEQKERIIGAIKEESKAQEQKMDWEDFKGSDMYTMMFEDIEYLGTKSIEVLKNKLTELKSSLSNLPATDVKEIINQIEKLEDVAIERNPFKSLASYMMEIRKLRSEGKTEDVLQTQFVTSESNIENYQEELDAVNSILSAKERGLIIDGQIADTSDEIVSWNEKYNMYLTLGTNELTSRASTLNNQIKNERIASNEAKKGLNTYKSARKALKATADEWGNIKSLASQAYDGIKTIVEVMGGDADSIAMTLADSTMSLLDLVAQAVMFELQLQAVTIQAEAMGVAMNAAMGPIGWIVIAIQAIATLMKAIFSAKDKALQNQIEEQKRKIENLQKAYDKLKEKVDDAYSIKDLQKYNEEMKENLELQIEAQKIAIAAQEQRKGAQREGSKAWQELQDMQEELDGMMEKQAKRWEDVFSKATDGILDNVLDAAREFTDAWWDAFQETGDGLSGLEENFDEMISNMIKQQASMSITSSFVEKWKNDLSKYLNENDLELTAKEAKSWLDEVRATLPQLSENLQNVWGEMADLLKETTEGGELSGLEKGISSITEETAEILAAYANSIRFINQDTNDKLTLLLENYNINSRVSSDMLNELRNQTRWLRDIYNMFYSMSSPYSAGGLGLKVVMNI